MSSKKNKKVAALIGKAYTYSPRRYKTTFLDLMLNLYRRELVNDLKDLRGTLETFEVHERKKDNIDGIIVSQHRLDSLVLAYLLNRRLSENDYNLVPIVCDGILPICKPKEALCTDKKMMIDDGKCNFICDYVKYQNSKILELLDLDYLVYSDFLDVGNNATDIKNKADLEGILGNTICHQFIDSSLKEYFRVGVLPEKKEVNEIKNRFAASAWVLKKVAEAVFKKYDIKDIFIYESSYVDGGVFGEVARVKGINVINISEGFHGTHQQSQMFYREDGTYLSLNTPEGLWNDFKRWELNKKSEDLLYTIIKSRQHGVGLGMSYLKKSEGALAKTYTNWFPNKNAPTFGLFTNVIWDSSITASNTLFNNIFEWIECTIKWFADHPNKNLIIKVHPEPPTQTKQDIYKWIIENFDLPDNIIVLPQGTKVNPYELYKELDSGIVYTSTAGLEMLLEEKPVIVCADTHYAHRGFTVDPQDVSEYKNILENNPRLSNEQYNLCKKYAYLFFVLRHFWIDAFDHSGRNLYTYSMVKLYPEKMLKALKGEDLQIERICNCIINNEYFVNSDDSTIRELFNKQVIDV